MSQPTRYTTKLLQSDKTGRLEVCPCYEGEWVAYSDYAALAAEVEQLKGAKRYIEILKDKNHHLIKAGDAMARCIQPPAHGPGEYEYEYYAWFDAKEGRNAK